MITAFVTLLLLKPLLWLLCMFLAVLVLVWSTAILWCIGAVVALSDIVNKVRR